MASPRTTRGCSRWRQPRWWWWDALPCCLRRCAPRASTPWPPCGTSDEPLHLGEVREIHVAAGDDHAHRFDLRGKFAEQDRGDRYGAAGLDQDLEAQQHELDGGANLVFAHQHDALYQFCLLYTSDA